MKTLFTMHLGILVLMMMTATALSSKARTASTVPQVGSDGICYTYTVEPHDTCTSIALAYAITEAEVEKYNSDTWGWTGCDNIYQGDFICLSSGDPPMPVALPAATCGPQVPGTARPKDYSELSSLNPCLTGKCCIMGGVCSTSCSSSNCISGCDKDADQTTASKADATTAVKSSTTAEHASSSTSTTSTKSTTKSTATTEHTSSTKTTSITSSIKSTTTTEKKSSTKTTTAVPAATGTGLWTLAAYTGTQCDGEYFVLTGNSLADSRCLSLHEGLSFETTDGVSCGYYYDGGNNYTDCENSPKEVWVYSWSLTGGTCVAYTDGCGTSDYNTVDVPSATGCQAEGYLHNMHYYMIWTSLMCQVS
ncbi:hypothetical protein N7466_005227 [Penicillium verhagenii]|uniref:uncharacterized protein n=1 Tax=Penicillium verhagenii TaxID=1562060 RepID=UPI002544F9FD|nr:uncharacterized protein N7466_005227 [Penicillium verhagenii]KAJ5935680.1 hypothetical protein N7466_005227 [Penicillium verhagenii]